MLTLTDLFSSHPEDAKDQKSRRTVRSHVTRQQHHREQQVAAAFRRSNSAPQSRETDQLLNPEGRVQAIVVNSERPRSGSRKPRPNPISSSSSPEGSILSVPLEPSHYYPAHWLPYISAILDQCR